MTILIGNGVFTGCGIAVGGSTATAVGFTDKGCAVNVGNEVGSPAPFVIGVRVGGTVLVGTSVKSRDRSGDPVSVHAVTESMTTKKSINRDNRFARL